MQNRQDRLTNLEICTGQQQGKLSCIKMYRNRTGCTLIDSKNCVEEEFERLELDFYKHS